MPDYDAADIDADAMMMMLRLLPPLRRLYDAGRSS